MSGDVSATVDALADGLLKRECALGNKLKILRANGPTLNDSFLGKKVGSGSFRSAPPLHALVHGLTDSCTALLTRARPY
jgi:hypothetical protein